MSCIWRILSSFIHPISSLMPARLTSSSSLLISSHPPPRPMHVQALHISTSNPESSLPQRRTRTPTRTSTPLHNERTPRRRRGRSGTVRYVSNADPTAAQLRCQGPAFERSLRCLHHATARSLGPNTFPTRRRLGNEKASEWIDDEGGE